MNTFSWLQAQRFEPPSTWIVSPVIQRASSEARKATTPPMSSGWARRFRACIPSVKARPASVLVKFDMSVSTTPGGDGIDANAARAKHESEVLHQRVDGPLRRGVRRKRADSGMGRERRKQDDTATAAEDRQELLHKEEGCPDVDGEEIVEILNRIVFDRCGLGDAGIGDEDIQTIAHDGADLLGELVRPIRRGEIGSDGVGAAAGLADFRDDRFCLFRAAAVMDKYLGAGLGEGQRTGAADAARGAGDEGSFS
jgi:hypothetical protein